MDLDDDVLSRPQDYQLLQKPRSADSGASPVGVVPPILSGQYFAACNHCKDGLGWRRLSKMLRDARGQYHCTKCGLQKVEGWPVYGTHEEALQHWSDLRVEEIPEAARKGAQEMLEQQTEQFYKRMHEELALQEEKREEERNLLS